MGWFTDALTNLDRPSNALQGLAVEGLSGATKGWNQERNYDFEELMSDEFRTEHPDAAYWGSGVANFVVDPLNLVGAGLFTKGAKGIEAARKAGATIDPKATDVFKRDGDWLSSFPNYIPDFYGPSLKTKEWTKKTEDLLSGKKKVFPGAPAIVAQNKELLNPIVESVGKGYGGLRWLGHGFKNMAKQGLNTERRALQAEKGINQSLMDGSLLAGKSSDNPELVARAMYNADILSQQGKQVPQELQEILQRTFLTSNTPLKANTYETLVNSLSRSADNLAEGPIEKMGWSQSDLQRMGKHLYEGPHTSSRLRGKGKKLSPNEDKGMTLLNIKRQQGSGGNHYSDLTNRAAIMSEMADAMGKYGIQAGKQKGSFESVAAMAEAFKKSGIKVADNAVDKDGIWIQRTYSGSSIREGGYNLAVKVKPDGDFLAMMSDEHNFFENLGGDLLLKNRMISATIPMTGNLKIAKSKKVFGVKSKQIEQKWLDEIEQVGKVKAPNYLDANTLKTVTNKGGKAEAAAARHLKGITNARALTQNVDLLDARRLRNAGTGMLTANSSAPEPVYRDSSYNWNNR